MGDVYLAQDPHIDRQLAIKTVRVVDGRAEEIAERKRRLLREAKAAGKLLHPHVVALFDAGEADGLLYLAFEYVPGQDLHRRIATPPPLTLREVLRIVREVCDALGYAHTQDIVHRDIKPSNILLADDGRAKVADFGIAKLKNQSTELTRTGSVVGSPQYMSPEQVRGEALDGRSDLFSVGVLLYELLSRTRPFEGETLSTLVFQILSQEPPSIDTLRPGLPPRLISLVHRMLAKDRDHRVAAAREAIEEILELERGLPPEQLDAAAAAVVDHDATARLQTPVAATPPPMTPPAAPALVDGPPTVPSAPALAPPPPPVQASAPQAPPAAPSPPPTFTETPGPTSAPPASTPAVASSPLSGTLPARDGGGKKWLPLALGGCLVLGAALLGGGWWVGSRVVSEIENRFPESASAGTGTGEQGAGGEEPSAAAEGTVGGSAVDDAGDPGPADDGAAAGAVDEGADARPSRGTGDDGEDVPDTAAEAPSLSAPVPSPVPPPSSPPPTVESPPPSTVPPTTSPPPPVSPPPSVQPTPPPPPPRVEPEPEPEPTPPPPPPPPAEPTPAEEWDVAAAAADAERTLQGELRFELDPEDAIVRTWLRGDRRAVVQGNARYFRPKRKGERSLELPPGDYLITFVHDRIGEYTIKARIVPRGSEPQVVELDLFQAPRR